MNSKGRLFLIPTPLGDNDPSEVLCPPIFERIAALDTFVVEEIRTARRFLSRAGRKGEIEQISFYELNEHSTQADAERYVKLLDEGHDVGLISEAGLPAVADPGAMLVKLAHEHEIEVVPFTGPSSLMLALMSSGMNGQCFAFTGYLPVKSEERKAELRRIEKVSAQFNQSQIIIETPYRNDSLLADMLSVCAKDTRICVAADITLPTQTIRTRTVEGWKKNPITIGKRPCVFVLNSR
ncbi:MAG: SAM-dependent methyltransferase [Bacteroidales bacterium]|nr:SAM-dependent methyltransferase [Bacteroidales bacterium]